MSNTTRTTPQPITQQDDTIAKSLSYPSHSPVLTAFDRMASAFTRWAASPLAFGVAVACVAVWVAAGPVFNFSENWKIAISIGTPIITFFMVFLLQQSQNKDSVAIHLKLNELLAANHHASNRMIGIEALSEQHLRDVASFYERLSERTKTGGTGKEIHSIDDEGMPSAQNSNA